VACPSSGLCPPLPGPPPPPPGPPGPPAPAPPGTYSCSSTSVSKGTTVFANATFFDGMPAGGCSVCDCCHDYISDCDACVNTKCIANASSGSNYQCSMFVHQTKVDNQRHPPVPMCYRHTATDAPGGGGGHIPKGQFSNSACGKDGTSACGHDDWLPVERLMPPGPHNCTAQAKSAGYPRGEGPWKSDCDTCAACCRDDVDCAKCVQEECPPSGVWFACAGAHGGRHGGPGNCLPLDKISPPRAGWWKTTPLYASATCGGHCLPFKPAGTGSFTCFGDSVCKPFHSFKRRPNIISMCYLCLMHTCAYMCLKINQLRQCLSV
jgi:hypothetical protein